MKDKLKYLWFLLLLLLILLLLSVPQVRNRTTVTLEELSAFPELETAYQKASREAPDLMPGAEIEIFQIDSIWGSCDYYMLPCYQAEMNPVPENGQAFWFASLHMVSACSDEGSITGKLFKPKVGKIRLEVQTGEETLLSTRVEITPGDLSCDTRQSSLVELKETFGCSENPVIRIKFLASTAMGTEEENKAVSGAYVWNYDLYSGSKQICKFRNVTLTRDYLVNAT